MLKQRLITGAILGLLAIWAMLALPSHWLAILLGLFFAIGGWEWGRLAGLKNLPLRTGYLLLLGVIGWQMSQLAWSGLDSSLYLYVLFGWLLVLLVLSRIRVVKPISGICPAWLLMGFFTLLPSYLGLMQLHAAPQYGPDWMLYVICLLWVVDSGAYFAGKRWGKHKLAPVLSPGKTWQGVAGGLAAAAIYALLGGWLLELTPATMGRFLLLTLLAAALSVVGDLLESLLKRHAGEKDSGRILPGHGGVLDRIDSLLAAAPVFVAGLSWI